MTSPSNTDKNGHISNSGLAPTVGLVSLGCPKALVDSERIVSQLRAEGYRFSRSYDDANVVIVNTCGFLDSAKAESLEAISEAMHENGNVIVTGCLGVEEELIRKEIPNVLAVSGPHQYKQVMEAVHKAAPPVNHKFLSLLPERSHRLTPDHYAYLKISEGCNNSCSFCIIPSIRGKLASRPIASVLSEAEQLKKAGVKELLVVSQDTSAYGLDINYDTSRFRNQDYQARFYDLAEALGALGLWIRLHYVYPYPHVDKVLPLMADKKILPYLDIPFQHASPKILKAMRRPAHAEKTLTRIENWRKTCPDLAIRSSFIVGFPGETEADFEELLSWLREARIDRAGCFPYENVTGAPSYDHDHQVPDEIINERQQRFMETAMEISAENLSRRVGSTVDVIIDHVEEDDEAVGRTVWDAPEIDGRIFLPGEDHLNIGDIVTVTITDSDAYDLWGEVKPPQARA